MIFCKRENAKKHGLGTKIRPPKPTAQMRERYSQMFRGENAPKAKLRSADIPTIRKRITYGEKLKYIAKDFQVHPSTISKIKRGITWI